MGTDVLIIGAGMAGLTAARVLKSSGRSIKIIEGADRPGGRVATDELDGFLLDRGFQVLLTAYPEAQRFLDYKALDLCIFEPGAIILDDKGRSMVGDPLRRPLSLIPTLLSPAGNFADKLRMLRLKLKLSSSKLAQIFNRTEITTLEYLEQQGFTDQMISQFFKPFMTGIFLEDQLVTSSRMFEFVFKMFSEGDTAIPAKGMGMIPAQMAKGLSSEELMLNETVVSIELNEVITGTGERYDAKKILIATDGAHLPKPFQYDHKKPNSVINMYFSAFTPPFMKPIIALNAMPGKLVNNIAVMDQISPAYAPHGRSLVSVSLIGDKRNSEDTNLPVEVIKELKQWFPEANDWDHLKTYDIPYGLPNDEQVINELTLSNFRLTDYCFQCGDHLLNGSLNAAMKSGRQAAEFLNNLLDNND